MPPLRSWSQNEKPPAVPMPGMAGGAKAKAIASGHLGPQGPVDGGQDRLGGEARVAALVPGLEGDEEEGGVGGRGAGEQAEAVDGGA